MSSGQIRDMDKSSEYFVSTCSHINESEEIICLREKEDHLAAKDAWKGIAGKSRFPRG